MAERSRVTNISSGPIPLPATYGGKLIAPGAAEIVADTNANVVAAFGGARAVAGVVRVEFVPDSTPATVAAVEFGVPQAYVDAGDAATLAAANVAADAGDAAIGAAAETYADGVGADAATYADTVSGAAQTAAEAHADAAAAAAQAAAEAYTDQALVDLPVGVVAIPMQWYRGSPTQGLTEDGLSSRPGGPGGFVWRAGFACSLVGISANLASQITAGSLTFGFYKGNGNATLTLVCQVGLHVDGGAVVQAAGIDTIAAGAQCSMWITTTGDMDPFAVNQFVVEAWAYVVPS